MKCRAFLGVEAEGPFIGKQTLFVIDNLITVDEIMFLLNNYPKVEQIYFGAGNNRKLPELLLDFLLVIKDKFIITIEFDDFYNIEPLYKYPSLINRLNLVYTIPINYGCISPLIKSVKLLGNKNLSWINSDNPIITYHNDPLYIDDEKVL